jgi:hypothetical protein
MLHQYTKKKNYLKKINFKKLKNHYFIILFYLKKLFLTIFINKSDSLSYIYFNNKKLIDSKFIIEYIIKYNFIINDVYFLNNNYNNSNYCLKNNSKLLIIKKFVNFLNLINYFILNKNTFNIYYVILNDTYYTFNNIAYLHKLLNFYYTNTIYNNIDFIIYIINKYYIYNLLKILILNNLILFSIIK